MRLKEWEQGPLKRLGTLLLSACISELTVHDLENVREQDGKKILADIEKGRATRDDFEFENGTPKKRKTRYYIDMKGMKESFTPTRKSRKLSQDSTENTLVRDRKNPEAINKIPVTEEYVMPDWYAESGILFDTKVDSKRMITNKKIRDTQSLQSVLNNILQAAQVDPSVIEKVDFAKFIETSLKLGDMESENIMKNENASEEQKVLEKISKAKQSVLNPNPNVAPAVNAQQPQPQPAGQAGPANALQAAATGSL
jgi:hypothetical protein